MVAGQDQGPDRTTALSVKGVCAGLQGGSGGAHVINQHEIGACQASVSTLKGILNVESSLRGPESYLGTCGPDSQETVLDDWQTDALAEFAGEQGRLVVPSLTSALRVQGHGHNGGYRKGSAVPCLGHYLAKTVGQYSCSVVLEMVYGLSHGSFKVGYCSNAIDLQRAAETAIAQTSAGQRATTHCTYRRFHRIEAGYAVVAKPFATVAARHTMGREDQIQDGVLCASPR